MRLFELEAICENCLAKKSPKIALKKQQRESKEEDAEAAIAPLLSMRRIDRPPQAKKIWGLRRIVCTLIR